VQLPPWSWDRESDLGSEFAHVLQPRAKYCNILPTNSHSMTVPH
jgi:hypothetical protein